MKRNFSFILAIGISCILSCSDDDVLNNSDVPPGSDPVNVSDSVPDDPQDDNLVLDITPDEGYYVQNPVSKSFGKTIAGFYEGLPPSYATATTTKYPLFIYFVGTGERGYGTPEELTKVLDVMGPAQLIHNRKFPSDFLVDNKYLSPVVLSIQTKPYEVTAPEDIESLINYALANYRIDRSRVYLTGLSMGGGAVWAYIALSAANARRIAAIATMGAKADPSRSRAKIIADANVHAWAFHNEQDDTVPSDLSIYYIEYLNELSPGLGKLTLFQDTDHNCWKKAYPPWYKEDGLNVYEWMLQFKK